MRCSRRRSWRRRSVPISIATCSGVRDEGSIGRWDTSWVRTIRRPGGCDMVPLDKAKLHRGDAVLDARPDLVASEETWRARNYAEDEAEAEDTAPDLWQMNLWRRIDGRARIGAMTPRMDLRQTKLWQRIDRDAQAPAPDATGARGKSVAGEAAEAHAGGSPSSVPDSAAQQAPIASAPLDLGNYDSVIGKHVVVIRGWDNPTIAARRIDLQGRLSRTADG